MTGSCCARSIVPLDSTILPLDDDLIARDEETKALLSWLNVINSQALLPPPSDNSRARALPAPAEDSYVEKDGFVVAKSPSAVPPILEKCEGFVYILVGPCE